LRSDGPWQSTIGTELVGATLLLGDSPTHEQCDEVVGVADHRRLRALPPGARLVVLAMADKAVT
jgi:hypothetical protein